MHARIAIALMLPALMGTKCISYDESFEAPAPVSMIGSDSSDASFSGPLTLCAVPGTALLKVENFAYIIQCGCAESAGKTCTVAAGTRVRWQFADSTEHNVTSLSNSFGVSTDSLSGSFEHLFTLPGRFGYGCSIHSADMSGYAIIVK